MGFKPLKCPWADIPNQLADCFLVTLDIPQDFLMQYFMNFRNISV